MKKEFELVKHSKIRHLNIFMNHIIYRNFHAHSDFELLLVLHGQGNVRIKNDTFSIGIGDVIFINPHDVHEIDSHDSGMDFLIIQFSRHFLNDYFPILRNTCFYSAYLRDCFSTEAYTCFLQTFLKLAAVYIDSEPFFELPCLHFMIKILMDLYEKLNYEVLDESAYVERKKRSSRMNRIAAYIDEHYTEPIRLQDMAKKEQISITRLSHFFTENFGVSFQEYLSDKRLEQALLLAGSGNYSLAALSELSGFSDPKYLNKAFWRKFGCPWNEYKTVIKRNSGQTSHSAKALEYYYSQEEGREILAESAEQFFKL